MVGACAVDPFSRKLSHIYTGIHHATCDHACIYMYIYNYNNYITIIYISYII